MTKKALSVLIKNHLERHSEELETIRISFRAQKKALFNTLEALLDNIPAGSLPKKMSKYIPTLKDRNGDITQEWYVEFYFIDKETKIENRFRLSEDLNTYKKISERRKYGSVLVRVFKHMLKHGWNPNTNEFYSDEKILVPEELSVIWLIERFLKEKKGLVSAKTVYTYRTSLHPFKRWLALNNLGRLQVHEVTRDHVNKYLVDSKAQLGWSNRTLSNNFKNLRGFFIYFQNIYPELIKLLPTNGIAKINYETRGNRPFTEKEFSAVKEYMQEHYPILLSFCQGIYFTGMRPHTELRNLKCGAIDFDRNVIRISSEISKTNKTAYIPLDPKYKEILISMGVDKADENDFVYTSKQVPGPQRLGKDYTIDRFKKVKQALKLSDEHSLYAFKHTRGIHLYTDTKDPYFIQRLFRHSSLEMTMHYLRDLGAVMDDNNFSKSRDF